MELMKSRRIVVVVVIVLAGVATYLFWNSAGGKGWVVEEGEKEVGEVGLELKLPEGYSVEKNAEMRESDIGRLYETLLVKGEKSIRVVRSNRYPLECEGTKRRMGNQEVCYFDFGENTHLPEEMMAILWSSESSDYQLITDDTGLSEEELVELIGSF